MRPGTLAAALGRCFGKFEEAWGGAFDWTDSQDIEALATLLVDEISIQVEREAHEAARKLIREWGESDND